MSEYATSNRTLNPITASGYFRLSSFVLALLGVLGLVLASVGQSHLLDFGMHPGFLTLTFTHSIVHLVLAGVAALLGFGNVAPNVVKTMAIVIGIVYVALAVIGFIGGSFGTNPLGHTLSLELGLGGNLVHLLLGALGLIGGFRGD